VLGAVQSILTCVQFIDVLVGVAMNTGAIGVMMVTFADPTPWPWEFTALTR
jgi:hypothetical protein